MATVQSILRSAIKPLLVRSGFQHKGNWFARPFKHGFDLIELQSRQLPPAEHSKVTFNLGLCWTRAEELMGRPVAGLHFSDDHHTIFRRIGEIMPQRRDHWWKLTPEIVSGSGGEEIREVLEKIALPWFDRAHQIDQSIALASEYGLIEFIAALERVKAELGETRGGDDDASAKSP